MLIWNRYTSSDVANPGKPAIGFDGINYLIVSRGETGQPSGPWSYTLFGVLVSDTGTVLKSFNISQTSNTYITWYPTPSVGFDGTNYLVVFYRDGQILGTRISQSGEVLDGPSGFVISSGGNPVVAFDGINYLVVWQNYIDLNHDIFGAIVTPDGQVLNEFPIFRASGGQVFPSIAFDGVNYFVVWSDTRSGSPIGSDADINGTRVTPGGIVLDPDGIPISTAQGSQGEPHIIFDGTNYFVVWPDTRNGGPNDFQPRTDIFGTRISPNGTLLDGPSDTGGIAISTAPFPKVRPRVGFDGTNYFVTWEASFFYDPPVGIFSKRVSSRGLLIDGPPDAEGISISQPSCYACRLVFPEILFNGEIFLIAWVKNAEVSGTTKDIIGVIVSYPVHNINKNTNYPTIQSAVDNASAGDEIHVDSGTYYENVNVSKQLILRGIDTGGGKPVVNASEGNSAITLSADGITLEGFIVVNASQWNAGIRAENSNNNLIRNNIASSNYFGILLSWSNNNTLVDNTANSNGENGIHLGSSRNNTISNNTANLNGNNAILLYSSNNNVLSGNILSQSGNGILLDSSNNNTLSRNNASTNSNGITLIFGGHNNTLYFNNASNNIRGIVISSNNNTINGNIANSNNDKGIFLSQSSNNSLSGNIISNNHNYGIVLFDYSNGNTIYNNFFNNINNAFDDGMNYWNITKQSGANIINGSYIGGNVWANPSSTGFSQTCSDGNNDGICDSTYAIGTNNIDYLPLWFPDTIPPAIIGNSPTGSNMPVDVKINVVFSEAMNKTSVESAFSITPTTMGNFSWNNNTMIYTPGSDLASKTSYTVTVGTGAMDLAGNNLQSPFSWQFTTSILPPPPTGGGGYFDLRGNARVLWNTTIQEGLSFASTHSNGEDYDIDGAPDIIAYSRDRSKMYLLSGKNGKNVWEKFLGFNVGWPWENSVNDLDGDGGSDFTVVTQHNINNYNYQNLIALKGRTGEALWNKSSGAGYLQFYQISDLGDISGDGKNDLLLNYNKLEGNYATSNLSAVRGSDGSELWNRVISSYNGSGYLPGVNSLTAGDLDKDGKQDVLVQTYLYPSTSPSIEAISGSSGSLIWSRSGYAIPAGDLSGDGYADVVFSDGNIIGLMRGYDASHLWSASGRLLALIDDVSGDNKIYVIVETQTVSGRQIMALSGSNGQQIWSTTLGVQADYVIGMPVKDLNGDGKEDLIAGAIQSYQLNANSYFNATIFGISGRDGRMLWSRAYNNLLNGWVWPQYAGDLNGDGKGDVAINVNYKKSMNYLFTDYLNITALSGYSGTKLWQIDEILPIQECSNTSPYSTICTYINPYAFIGDFDGNIKGDVLLIGNYSNTFGFASQSIQEIQSQKGNILSNGINPRKPVPEGTWGIGESGKGTMQAFGGMQTFNASLGGAPGGGGSGGGYPGSNSYYTRVFTGDDTNATLWIANSSNLVYPVGSWTMYDQNPGIDYDTDGFPDAALIVNNTIYMLVRDALKPSVTNLSLSMYTPIINEPVNITANIGDTNLNTSGIFVKVNSPGGHINTSTMIHLGSGTYYYNYTNTSEYGRYNVTIIATDLAGNINDTEKTWFVTTMPPYISQSVNTTANNVTTIDASEKANTTIELATSSDTTGGAINITMSNDIPPEMSQSFILNPLGKYISINATITNLTWIKLKLYYTKSELDASGLDEASLKISWCNESADPYRWDLLSPGSPQWVYGAGVETADINGYAGYVWANISHLSTFALVGSKIIPPSPPSSGGGGGGGGGGGTSGENFSNIEIKEKYDLYIFKDKITSYIFKNASNPIMHVNVTGKVNAGQITAMIEVLKGTSTLVSETAPGVVYKNTNLWLGTSGFAVPKNLKEVVIRFRVENSWMQGNNVDARDIKLLRWDSTSKKWMTLKTEVKEKEGINTYFEATSNSLSPLAISAVASPPGGPVAGGPEATPPGQGEEPEATVPKPKGTPGFEGAITIAALSVLYFWRKGR